VRRSRIYFLWLDRQAPRRFRRGVSLHGHTMHSRESLAFLPRFARRIPLLKQAVAIQERNYRERHGRPLDYSRGWWTPPLPEREAFHLERQQVESVLGLDALISLTDHDGIDAALHLHLLEESRGTPVSLEWTVPFGPSYLHLGIHNLPRAQSRSWAKGLAAYARRPAGAPLSELLAELSRLPEVLVVLNHPFWDEPGLGLAAHLALVERFLETHGSTIHALELNGNRPWIENKAVVQLARARQIPVVSGGDRHGSEPSVTVNLTNASTFDEFVREIREDGVSHILFLPRYREPFQLRLCEMVWDILRDYPELTGRERWTDRVFFRTLAGSELPLSRCWQGDGPGAVSASLAIIRLFGRGPVRLAVRQMLWQGNEMLP